MAEKAQWRQVRSEASVEVHKKRSRAQGKAKQRLVNAHRDEFEKYYAEERHKLGLS